MDELLPVVLEVGEVNLKCMALLDKANTETYGLPAPAEVSLTVEKGPFIVISGHDLYDLKQLLEQTENKGSTFIHTAKCFPHTLIPNLRSILTLREILVRAWQNQQKEFADIPAPVLLQPTV